MPYVCFKCNRSVAVTTRQLVFHLKGTHSIANNENLVCFQDGCMQTFNTFNSYLNHIRYFHPVIHDNDIDLHPDDIEPINAELQNIEDDIDIVDHDMEEQCHAAEHNYLVELTEQQIQSQAAQCIIHMRGTASIPTSTVTEMVNSTSMLFQNVVGSLKENVKVVLQESNIDMQSDIIQELMGKFESFSNPFIGLETPFQQTKYLKENMKMVSPISLALGTRYDQYVDKLTGTLKQKLVTETFQYVPVLKTLECILPGHTMHLIGTERPAGEDSLIGFVDGEQFSQHPLFKECPNGLRIQLYYDDVELANPLGSKNTIHKVSLFYFTLDNLHRKFNSCSNTVHLLAVCHAIDLKRYGFGPILRPFVDEIKQLESDTGVVLQLTEGPTTVHGTLVSVVGDTLAMHDMFGMLSPSATKLCRMCLATRDDIQSKFTQDEFIMRDIESHAVHVEEAEYMPNGNSATGVKKGCPLNELRYFHTATNYNFDIMHDLLEGICPFEVKLLLNQCIYIDRYVTLEELNHRMKSFSYQFIDRKNKPSQLTRYVVTNLADHKLRQHASQMWCLMRMLPFLIGDKVPVGNKYYELLLLLLRCMDIVFSPHLRKSQIIYLKHLIDEHHTQFKYLYPNFRFINKHHHMVHYPTCIMMCGPLSTSSSFKYETKNGYSKTIGHVNCNFRNICKSVAAKHQIHHAAAYSGNIATTFECKGGDVISVQTLPAHITIADFFGLDINELFLAKSVKIFGISYRPNLYIVVKLNELTKEPIFSLITQIIVHEQQEVYFVARTCTTVRFCPHYHSYKVMCNQPHDYHIVQPKELLDHLPYSAIQSYNDENNNSYISMRYVI